jgi:two-component sensor histidine kinase
MAAEPLMTADTMKPHTWDTRRLRIANEAAGVALWSWNTATDEIALDDRALALWGMPAGAQPTFEGLSAKIHPEDLDRVRAAFSATREVPGPYEIDFRILHEKAIRWISARGRGDDEGIVGRLMFGVFLDVTERKLAEEGRELLAREMSHRVKNLFAIAAALTSISARAAATPQDMAADLSRRLIALGRAHELVRPSLAEQKKAASLGVLLGVLLGAYDDRGVVGDRIRLTVPDVLVGEASITTLALIIHELATNSLKYGALSYISGLVDITCTADDREVTLVWSETGGPPIGASHGQPGFGTTLIRNSVSNQLGGTIEFAWPHEGAIVTVQFNRALLGA